MIGRCSRWFIHFINWKLTSNLYKSLRSISNEKISILSTGFRKCSFISDMSKKPSTFFKHNKSQGTRLVFYADDDQLVKMLISLIFFRRFVIYVKNFHSPKDFWKFVMIFEALVKTNLIKKSTIVLDQVCTIVII